MIGLRLGATVMMQLGSFQFSLATAAFQDLRRSTEYRWPSQDRMGKAPALQFTGPGADTITLSGVIFPEFRGGSRQVDAMRALAAKGQPQLLVDGFGRMMGKWVIESIQEEQSTFAAFGQARKQTFTMQLRKREL